ncbi:MAG: YggS family pyridoxal phosphate-dependent enzyme [Propionibacterium sp.]|nr:YggS family pyridoxal phosphate-dependent enzyme [Propionibacterium sp.]
MDVAENLRHVEERIVRACADAGRDPGEVRLLPVSKTQPIDPILRVSELGYRRFGENRMQDLQAKTTRLRELGHPEIEFCVIGHLQTNKARIVAELVTEFQALDSVHLARELDRRCEATGRRLDVLVQVNSSGEASKSGIVPDDVLALAAELRHCPWLRVRGLMTIAVNSPQPGPVLACFDRVVEVQRRLRDAAFDGLNWDDLSMGMTNDLELAISRGATCVRVGRAIFGERATRGAQ